MARLKFARLAAQRTADVWRPGDVWVGNIDWSERSPRFFPSEGIVTVEGITLAELRQIVAKLEKETKR